MARSPRSSNGKPSKQVDALKHNEATPAEHSDGGDGELLPARRGCGAAAAEALSARSAAGGGRDADGGGAEPARADLERRARSPSPTSR